MRTIGVLALLCLFAACSAGTSTGGHEGHAGLTCTKVGDASKASTTVNVEMKEWAVVPETAEARAGTIHFALDNSGKHAHELAIAKFDDPLALPTDDAGMVVEDGLELAGRVEQFPPEKTCDGTFEIAAGKYVLYCNIENAEEGAHYKQGMRTGFTVT